MEHSAVRSLVGKRNVVVSSESLPSQFALVAACNPSRGARPNCHLRPNFDVSLTTCGAAATTLLRMDITWVSALSGVLGSLVGGSVTFATAWVTQRTVSRRELINEEMRKRETLYNEFIGECATRLVDALAHHLESPEPMLPVYALMNRIRLTASKPVLIEAERLLVRISEQYFSEPLGVEELRRLARSWSADPLKAFGEACRAELAKLRGGL